MPNKENISWKGKTGGSPWMQNLVIWLYRILPSFLLYIVMAFFIPFYVISDGRGRRASWSFFRQRMHYSPLKSVVHVFLNMFNMGMVVMDRFAAFAGKKFNIQTDGLDYYNSLCSHEDGFVILSSHIGNYEIVGYCLRAPKHLNVLVYAGETDIMMSNRKRMFEKDNVTMIPVREDMSHLYQLNSSLSRGEIVSLPADRVFGSSKTVDCIFMGAPTRLPAGPFTLAVARDTSVLAIFNLKTGLKSYKVILRPIAIPKDGTRQERISAVAQAFASEMEKVVRTWPDQWYNFYDFWAQ